MITREHATVYPSVALAMVMERKGSIVFKYGVKKVESACRSFIIR